MSSPGLTPPRLEMRGIRKRFGATLALDGVDLSVAAGEVHALLGENGAGKSTLMKVLSGAVRPDSGEMAIDGKPFSPGNPQSSRAAGVAIVYQELNLAPHLTVEENLTLGIERHTAGLIRPSAQRERIEDSLRRLNRPDIRPDTPVSRLSPAGRQLVEIARALMTDARILILDEPTSSLGLADIEHLFGVIRRMRDEGVAVVYISHFLEEVQQIAEAYTVLRDGRTAGSGRMQGARLDHLVEQMIGRRLEEMFPRVAHEIGPAVLEVENVCGRPTPVDASLTLRRGEILGLAGLVGAGRTELLRAIFGLAPVKSGRIRVAVFGRRDGKSGLCEIAVGPAACLESGIGFLSEDRQAEGLALSRTILDNLTLSQLTPFSRGGWLNLRQMRRATAVWIERLSIRARGGWQRAGDLSGGNQQKIAIARLLHHDVDVLLLDEPTRGIDVASKAQIYQLIGELAARGKSVLLVSSYVPELIGVCDRIAVMHRGGIAAVRPAASWTEHEIIAAAASGKEAA